MTDEEYYILLEVVECLANSSEENSVASTLILDMICERFGRQKRGSPPAAPNCNPAAPAARIIRGPARCTPLNQNLNNSGGSNNVDQNCTPSFCGSDWTCLSSNSSCRPTSDCNLMKMKCPCCNEDLLVKLLLRCAERSRSQSSKSSSSNCSTPPPPPPIGVSFLDGSFYAGPCNPCCPPRPTCIPFLLTPDICSTSGSSSVVNSSASSPQQWCSLPVNPCSSSSGSSSNLINFAASCRTPINPANPSINLIQFSPPNCLQPVQVVPPPPPPACGLDELVNAWTRRYNPIISGCATPQPTPGQSVLLPPCTPPNVVNSPNTSPPPWYAPFINSWSPTIQPSIPSGQSVSPCTPPIPIVVNSPANISQPWCANFVNSWSPTPPIQPSIHSGQCVSPCTPPMPVAVWPFSSANSAQLCFSLPANPCSSSSGSSPNLINFSPPNLMNFSSVCQTPISPPNPPSVNLIQFSPPACQPCTPF